MVCANKAGEIPSEVNQVVGLIDNTRAYVALQWMNMPLAHNPEFQIKYTKLKNTSVQLVIDTENAIIHHICEITEGIFRNVLVNITLNFKKVPNKTEKILSATKVLGEWLKRFPHFEGTSFQVKELFHFLMQHNFTVSTKLMDQFKHLWDIAAETHYNNMASNEYHFKHYGDEILFYYVNNVLDVELQKVYARFRFNISRVIIPRMIKKQEDLVDKVVMHLDQFLVAGLKGNFKDLEPDHWRQVTTQPYYRLQQLKELTLDIDEFVPSLKMFFKIHWVDTNQPKSWAYLNEAKKKFKIIEETLDTPIDTKHEWGRSLKASTDYLLNARSTANRPYAPINQVANWMEGAFHSIYCTISTTENNHDLNPIEMWNESLKSDNVSGFAGTLIMLVLIVKSLTST